VIILKNLFKFRDRDQAIGVLMGSCCFAPAFIISWMMGIKHPMLGIGILIISQFLWLTSIGKCCKSLEKENIDFKNENENLKKQIEELKK
jgi:hypothetical protein